MPKTNGLEVVLAIRKTYKKYELPIIGISSQKENAISFLKYGVNDFIRKPFFNEELSTRVNNTLDSIENVKKLNNFANTDFLTGVANRKYFYQEAQKYYTQCKLSKEPFVLAMFDIDFFKKINDTYGHDVGDIVIKELAKTLKNNVKGRDIVARLGGEEFCVVLKDIDAKSAYKFFDSLREKISTLQVKTTLSHTISFTVSVGISSKPYQNFDEMVKKSDVCLYEAKSQGRNRVCIDTQECVLA
jgi:diguanylate cyclase (GGDEF)-like protein